MYPSEIFHFSVTMLKRDAAICISDYGVKELTTVCDHIHINRLKPAAAAAETHVTCLVSELPLLLLLHLPHLTS